MTTNTPRYDAVAERFVAARSTSRHHTVSSPPTSDVIFIFISLHRDTQCARRTRYQILACCVSGPHKHANLRTEARLSFFSRAGRFYVHRGDAYRSTPAPVLHCHAILIAADYGNEVGRVRHCFRNS